MHPARGETPARAPRGPLALAMLALVVACSSAATVNTDFDRSADFTRYRTYTYVPGHPAKNQLVDRRIQTAIEEQLRAKGLSRTDAGGDLVTTYHAAVENEVDITTTGGGFYGPYWGGGPTTTQVRNVPVGTLIVDLIDSAGKRLVWRGEAKADLSSDPEKAEKQINDAVTRMFQKYPPAQ